MNFHILDGNCCLRTLLSMVTAQRLSGSATSACSPAAKYHAQHSYTLGCCCQQPQHTEYLAYCPAVSVPYVLLGLKSWIGACSPKQHAAIRACVLACKRQAGTSAIKRGPWSGLGWSW